MNDNPPSKFDIQYLSRKVEDQRTRQAHKCHLVLQRSFPRLATRVVPAPGWLWNDPVPKSALGFGTPESRCPARNPRPQVVLLQMGEAFRANVVFGYMVSSFCSRRAVPWTNLNLPCGRGPLSKELLLRLHSLLKLWVPGEAFLMSGFENNRLT